ncbi:MAG: helix-turn-helix domain-containing protein [Egibacteraceae bacterium]
MEHGSVGERIAYWRRRRGLSQKLLAGLVGRSASWMTKVERGDRIVDKLSVLLALSYALKVDLGKLVGGVELPPNGGGAVGSPPRGIVAVRRALFTVRPADREPPAAAELRAGVDRAKRLRYDGRNEAVGIVLPELISDARAAADQDAPDGWWCLAGAYQVASSLARTVGEVDLALLAADRAVGAAQRSGDGLLVAVSERLLASSLIREGLLDEAGAVCSDAADVLAPTDATPLEGWSVWGSLQLTGADVVVRGGDGVGAWRVLGNARDAGERVGPGRNDYWEAFGPANVGVYEIMVALESGDPVEALRIADTVEVDELPSAESRARFCIQVARAHALDLDDVATVMLLLEAERHSAEAVRHSVLARELVRVCLSRERRSRTPGLRGLAERLGVLD